MPNTIDATGLQTATALEQTQTLQSGMMNIYGSDINVSSNSPDGQQIGLFVQASQDILDVLSTIYNMFSIEGAFGILLQRLVAVNGIEPKNGTSTTTPVSITVDRALTLYGLDQSVITPFQVRDANNIWTLVSTFAFGGPGTQALVFRCTTLGPITPISNTITIQVTPTLGVTVVNNPTTSGTVSGQDEDTDAALRVRHGKSFKLAATGPADSVEAALLSLVDVTDALVVENATGAPVGSLPANTIWPIVVGGTAVEIAQAIYSKKGIGCSTFGGQSQVVARPNGQSTTINYDIGLAQQLFAKFSVIPTIPGLTFDKPLLAQQLAAALQGFWALNQQATIGDLVRTMFTIEPRAILTASGVSLDGMSYGDTVSPAAPLNYFTLAAADIDIT